MAALRREAAEKSGSGDVMLTRTRHVICTWRNFQIFPRKSSLVCVVKTKLQKLIIQKRNFSQK